jgi:rhamnulokinase
VIAGPVEATALGNVLVQALGLGLIPSASAAREMVRASVELETFKPR